MKKAITIIIVILLVAGALIIIRNKKAAISRTPSVSSYPMPVEVAIAKEGKLTQSSHYTGTILPLRYADIAPRITGNILSVYVREGDVVHKGQLLVSIDDRTLREKESAQSLEILSMESQLTGAKSTYETQEAIYERDTMLQKEGAISMEMLQRSKAQRDAAYAQVKSLEEKIKAIKNAYRAASIERSYAKLHAPMDGVITKRLQEPGDLAVVGKTILKIEGTKNFKIVVQIPQTEMPLIKRGGKVILSDGKDRLEALISRVYPAVTVATLGTIEIDVQNRPFDIPSGGTVGVDVVTGKIDKGIIVPLNALLENSKGSFVYKLINQRISILKVRVLGKNSEYASVKGALKDGDMVVIGDEGKLLSLSEGMIVSALPQRNTSNIGEIQ